MDATFMNSAKSETSDCHRLSFSLTDKINLTLFRMGGAKPPLPPPLPPIPTTFSLLTSTNVRISPKKLLTFSFNPFDRLL